MIERLWKINNFLVDWSLFDQRKIRKNWGMSFDLIKCLTIKIIIDKLILVTWFSNRIANLRKKDSKKKKKKTKKEKLFELLT